MIRAAFAAFAFPHGLRIPATVCYNISRSYAMGDKRPAPERFNGTIQPISAPCKRPTASRSISYPFARRGFCKWR